jgi:hypothetical protein
MVNGNIPKSQLEEACRSRRRKGAAEITSSQSLEMVQTSISHMEALNRSPLFVETRIKINRQYNKKVYHKHLEMRYNR